MFSFIVGAETQALVKSCVEAPHWGFNIALIARCADQVWYDALESGKFHGSLTAAVLADVIVNGEVAQ
jgi:hypothetical protein